ncbi:DUF1292 domain-containing protein [Evansella sp. AB-rgal1]|uniref:DUF1292 domain-containing protein n=1 Tax=Evansella sp. AB-rgal1 TaxID=3242696 RepID=UPI00359E855E
MSEKEQITIRDDEGNEKVFQVDAMFEMGDHSYAMVTSGDNTFVMRIMDNGDRKQSLISATDEEIENLMDAYNIALDADSDK